MIKTGWFADSVSTESGWVCYAINRHTGEEAGTFLSSDTSGKFAGFASHLRSFAKTTLPLAPYVSHWKFNPLMYGGYDVQTSGEPTPVPLPVLLSGPVTKSNNKFRWENAKKTGDIVVSDYTRMQCLLTFQNGGNKNIEKYETQQGVSFATMCSVMGIPRQTHHKSGTYFYDVGGEFLMGINSACAMVYSRQSTDDSFTAFEDGFQIKPILDFLRNPKEMYFDVLNEEVTSTLAEANMSTLDVLTSLAEMPETVRSIYDGLKFMLRGIKDVKRKKLAFLNKAKRVRTDYDRRIFRSEYETRQAYIAARNERERRRIKVSGERKVKQLKHDLQRSLDDLTKAAASVWLNYRYNIETTVMMIEDALNAFNFDKETFFKRWSSRVVDLIEKPEVNGFKSDGDINGTQRIFIKRGFPSSGFPGQNLSASLFVTAWELIPLSFVVDWIINVGDFIATALPSTLTKAYTEGSTISLKMQGSVTYTGMHNTIVTAEFKGYTRSVINPNDYCRLIINPDLSWKRQIDALALGWQIYVNRIWPQHTKRG